MLNLSRRNVLAALASTAAAAPALGRKTDRLDEIIRRHTLARGGARALDRVHAKRVRISIEEGGDRLDAVYQCTADPAWRIDVYAGGKHVFAEGLDPAGPWLWPGGAPAARDAVPDARRTGLQGIEFHLYGLHRFRERGHQLSLDAAQIINGVRYEVVRVVMRDAYETFLFLNPATWQIERRRDERAPHPDVDAKRKFIEKVESEFHSTQGVVNPFVEVQTNLTDGKPVNVSRVHTLEYNHSYSPDTFTRGFKAPEVLSA